MRPLRGRTWRSSPSNERRASSRRGVVDGWRRWLPRSTRRPATSWLAAMPPTRSDRSTTVTSWPARAARQAATSPAGPAPTTRRWVTRRRGSGPGERGAAGVGDGHLVAGGPAGRRGLAHPHARAGRQVDQVDGVVAVVLDERHGPVGGPAAVSRSSSGRASTETAPVTSAAQRARPARRGGAGPVRLAVEQVGVTHEAGHPRRDRILVEVGGHAHLHDATLGHHRHPVPQHEGLALVVGDEHGRHTERGEQPSHLGPHLHPQGGVEVRERLVEEQHAGFGGEGTGQRHPLLLPPGERAGQPVAQALEADHGERPVHPRRPGPAGQAVGDVRGHGHVREQGPVLEHHADLASLGRHPDRVARQHAPAGADHAGVGPLEPGDRAQQRGLAAPARSEEGDDLAGADLQVDVHEDGVVAEGLGQAGHTDRGRMRVSQGLRARHRRRTVRRRRPRARTGADGRARP